MSKQKNLGDLLALVGPPEQWMIPVEDIERIMVNGRCRHLLPTIEDCQPCFVDALTERQFAIMAERLGCTPEDAAAVGESLARKHRGSPS